MVISSTIPYKINELSLLYFKVNIVEQNTSHILSSLATIPIPVHRESPVKYEPINPIWYPLKQHEIREIKIQLTDEKNTKLNLTNGNLNFTLGFRTANCEG